jgi:GntR family transcriptional regulator
MHTQSRPAKRVSARRGRDGQVTGRPAPPAGPPGGWPAGQTHDLGSRACAPPEHRRVHRAVNQISRHRAVTLGAANTSLIGVMSRRAQASRRADEARLRLAAVDRSAPTLLHEQVAIEIRRAIADGEARPGERIPQAKDLAAVLGVNTNTVLRALRILRDQGLLEVGRGRAIRVAGTPARTEVIQRMKELIDLGRRTGYRRDELVALLESFPD